jgi:hypothetical protein
MISHAEAVIHLQYFSALSQVRPLTYAEQHRFKLMCSALLSWAHGDNDHPWAWPL